jgi:hypothetical protein
MSTKVALVTGGQVSSRFRRWPRPERPRTRVDAPRCAGALRSRLRRCGEAGECDSRPVASVERLVASPGRSTLQSERAVADTRSMFALFRRIFQQRCPACGQPLARGVTRCAGCDAMESKAEAVLSTPELRHYGGQGKFQSGHRAEATRW